MLRSYCLMILYEELLPSIDRMVTKYLPLESELTSILFKPPVILVVLILIPDSLKIVT